MRKLSIKKMLRLIIFIGIIAFLVYFFIFKKDNFKKVDAYISSSYEKVKLYDDNYKEVKEGFRCSKVTIKGEVTNDKNEKFKKIEYNDDTYLINENDITETEKSCVKNEVMYVRTPVNVYKTSDDINLISLIKKGEEVKITGFDSVTDGKVNMFLVNYNDITGYVYAKYLVDNKDDAIKNYDEDGNYKVHSARGNNYGGGSGANLDYYPYEKANFKDNVMPDEVRALYINSAAIKDVDSYISLAKESNINSFVVDIKDNESPAYPANAMKKYSKTNYDKALNSYDNYKSYIKKLKENGFYVIGRITLFKDSYYVKDHPESAIADAVSLNPYNHNNSYWPSAYDRGVWEFNVSLAIESVKQLGFNEIQFDYVRFPDRLGDLEKKGVINIKNKYNEEKAQALQAFLMYACDEIHKSGAYVSADVFGESAHTYITSYGQYFPAISNIVDVISAMPYPDHFNAHEYNISEVVWTVPYKLLNVWGSYASKRQNEIPTPAIARTWIQTYNTIRSPYITYDASKVSDQIDALYNNKLNGGYITWNSSSSLSKYKEISSAFKKER